VSLPSP